MPGLLLGAGVIAAAAGLLVLATFGSSLRIGRLLGSTPKVSVEEALSLARRGLPGYVRIEGRIDSENEFEDELHRPLVFRRQRIETRSGSSWHRLDEDRTAVDFDIREGLESIAIDHAALGDGLVVIPREAVGAAGEIPEIVGDAIPAATPVRLRIEQVSSVEHAVALGQPRIDDAGRVTLTAGLGRPLILTTLDPAEAMRILAGGSRLRPALAAMLLAGGIGCIVLGTAWLVVGAVA
jgi:hypothetical protein